MTDYYIDFNRGNDSNTGTSIAQAWKNITKLNAQTLTAGDRVFLANDSQWVLNASNDSRINVPAGGWNGTENNPVLITSYDAGGGSSALPIIESYYDIQAAEWTWNSTYGFWTYDFGYNTGSFTSVLFGLEGFYGAGREPGASLGGLVADGDHQFQSGTNLLHVYAPAATNPTDYYGRVRVSSGFRGVINCGWNYANHLIIENIKFQHSGCGVRIIMGSGAGQRFITVRNLVGYKAGLVSVNTGSGAILTLVADRLKGDTSAAPMVYTYEASGTGTQNKFEVKNSVFKKACQSASQGAIYLQMRGGAVIHHNEISETKGSSKYKLVDSCGIYMEAGCENAHIYSNYIHDQFRAFQDNSGRPEFIYGNIIANCAIGLQQSDASSIGSGSTFFANNTHVNVCAEVGRENSTQATAFISQLTNVSSQIVNSYNNIAIAVNASGTQAFRKQVNSVLNSTNDCVFGFGSVGALTNNTGMITSNPALQNLLPTLASPCREAGVKLSMPIMDYLGRQIAPNQTPDIGAMQIRQKFDKAQK